MRRSSPRMPAVMALVALALVMLVAPTPVARAQGAETIGVITEIKPGRGRVEVKPAGGADWRPAGPLLALRAGDSVRATEDAAAVVVLTGGRGSVRVDAAAPLVVAAGGAPESTAQKARTLVERSLGFLAVTSKEAPKGLLATRGVAPPPVVLSPRSTLVRAESLAFEWVGTARSRYAVRLVGAGGVVFERNDVVGPRLTHPDDAPALRPGARYTVEVRAGSSPPQQAEFEVLTAEHAQAVARDLGELDAALATGMPASSRAVVRAGYLAEQRLFHEARDVIVRALRADPDEAVFYVLLGNVYERTGLPAQAAAAFEEARWLGTRSAPPAGKP